MMRSAVQVNLVRLGGEFKQEKSFRSASYVWLLLAGKQSIIKYKLICR